MRLTPLRARCLIRSGCFYEIATLSKKKFSLECTSAYNHEMGTSLLEGPWRLEVAIDTPFDVGVGPVVLEG